MDDLVACSVAGLPNLACSCACMPALLTSCWVLSTTSPTTWAFDCVVLKLVHAVPQALLAGWKLSDGDMAHVLQAVTMPGRVLSEQAPPCIEALLGSRIRLRMATFREALVAAAKRASGPVVRALLCKVPEWCRKQPWPRAQMHAVLGQALSEAIKARNVAGVNELSRAQRCARVASQVQPGSCK